MRYMACVTVLGLAAALMAGGCSSAPAKVSHGELEGMRKANASLKLGAPKAQVLKSFEDGNVVKLGASAFGEAMVEEWKAEGFHDEHHRKDLFVTFLYFCNDKFVDSSDTRIDFRNNEELVKRWHESVK